MFYQLISNVIYAISVYHCALPMYSNIQYLTYPFKCFYLCCGFHSRTFYFKSVYIPKQSFNDATKQLEIDVDIHKKF